MSEIIYENIHYLSWQSPLPFPPNFQISLILRNTIWISLRTDFHGYQLFVTGTELSHADFSVPMCRLLMLLNNRISLDNSYQSTTQDNFENLSVQKKGQIFQKACEDERESGYALCTLCIFIRYMQQNTQLQSAKDAGSGIFRST